MSDERAPKRQQTQTERDMDGLAARRERVRSAPFGVPVNFDDDITGNYEGEELAQMRALRPPPDRLAHLERKYDKLGEKVDGLGTQMTGLEGQLKTTNSLIPQVLDLLKGKTDAAVAVAKDNNETARLGMTTRAKVIIAVLGTVSAVLTAAVASMAGCA